MRKRRIIGFGFAAAVWLLAAALPRPAETASLFSMNLVGERMESGDTRAITLGGSSQLIVDSLGVLSLNTAMLVRLENATIGVTQLIAVDEGRSEFYNERDISVAFSSFKAAFPLYSGIVLSLGYQGRYNPEGGLTLTDTTASGDGFKKAYTRSGGLFSIPVTLSFKLTRFVALGATFSIERGTVEDRWDTVFDESGFAPGAGVKTEDLRGFGVGGSVAAFILPGLIVGGMWESPINYDSDVRERYTQGSLDTTYTSTVRLPARMNVSATLQLGSKLQIMGSYAQSDFTTFEGLSFPTDRLNMEKSLSVGLEWARNGSLARPRWPLRLGFNYQELPYDHPSGQPITKYLVSLGTGVPFAKGRGKIDIGIQGGVVGAMNENIIEDRLIRIYFSLTGSEKWRRKSAAEI